jgi:hypothetical protein
MKKILICNTQVRVVKLLFAKDEAAQTSFQIVDLVAWRFKVTD